MLSSDRRESAERHALAVNADNIPEDPNVRPLPTIVRAGRSRVSS
jgi:hypothetical protein